MREFKQTESTGYSNWIFYEELKIPPHIIRIIFGQNNIHPTGYDSTGLIWDLNFKFKDNTYLLSNHKNGLSLYGPNEDETYKSIIMKKITSCSIIIDKLLKGILSQRIEEGNFLIYNTFRELSGMYNHYKRTVRFKIKESGSETKKWKKIELKQATMRRQKQNKNSKGIRITRNIEFENYLNKMYFLNSDITYLTIALIFVFYSLCEILFSLFYIFQKGKLESKLDGKTSHEKYLSFTNLSWDEKFKMVIDMSTYKKFLNHYKDLLKIKRSRNNIIHGMFGRENYCIMDERMGIIPISYADVSDHYFNLQVSIDEKKSLEIIRSFDDFLTTIMEVHPYDCMLHFLQFSLFVPFNDKDVNKILNEMMYCNEFREKFSQVEEHNQIMNLL